MSFICPYCSFENLDPSSFCVHCGKKLSTSEITGNTSSAIPSPYVPVTPPVAVTSEDVQEEWEKTLPPSHQPSYPAPSTPSTPFWGAPPLQSTGTETPSGAQSWGSVPPPPLPASPNAQQALPPGQPWGAPPPPHQPYAAGPIQQGQQWGAPPNPPSSLSHMGRTTLASLRRAFAGYGTLITHHSWLLEGKKEQGEVLASTIKEKLMQQRYSGSAAKVEKLSEGNTSQLGREFLMTQKGNVAEFIYVAPGDDSLYLSRATVVQPSISNVRIGVLTLLALIVVLGPLITLSILRGMLSSLQSGFSGADMAALPGILQQSTFYAIGFSLLYSAALFFLFCLLLISVIAWLRDKDVLMYLRTNHLSDFQMDDVAMLEQSTDRVIRNVVDQAGLDAIHIVPPTRGYHPRRKLRFI